MTKTVVIVLAILGALIFINEYSKKADTSKYACKDQDRSRINWRHDCKYTMELAMAGEANAKKWCDCVESHFNFGAMADSNCKFDSPPITALAQETKVQAECGQPGDPR
jgi:hypothetical protein